MATSSKTEAKTPSNNTTTLAQRIAINSAPAWRPNVNDILLGELVGVRRGGTPKEQGGYGYYPVLVFRNIAAEHDEYVALHAFHTILKDQYMTLLKRGAAGDPDGLVIGGKSVTTYLGKRHENDDEKNTYHAYYTEVGDGSEQTAMTTTELDEVFGF